MLTIQMDQDLFTAAVFIDVAPDEQRRVLDINIEDTEEMLKHMPGMVAAIFHKSLDGERQRVRGRLRPGLRDPARRRLQRPGLRPAQPRIQRRGQRRSLLQRHLRGS